MNNSRRHLFSNYKNGHYSYLTKPVNLEKYPLFSRAVSSRVTVRAGEYVYIPSRWWHWVVSESRCASINFWFEKSTLGEVPYVQKNPEPVNWSDETISKMYGSNVLTVSDMTTDVSKYMTYEEFMRDGKTHKYFLHTLKCYDPNQTSRMILDSFSNDIEKLRQGVGAPPEALPNFWINYGDVDTGLHYDDYYGIICVLDGIKIIDLYEFNQSEFLYPHMVK
jgi:Cupin-like domain